MLATAMLLYANMNGAYITTTMVIAAALVDIVTVTLLGGVTTKYLENSN